jgi:hypothetical protein
MENLKSSKGLWAEGSPKSVVVVTNQWGLVDPDLGSMRELELKTDEIFFKSFVDQGTRFMRHDRTRDSAHGILQYLLARRLASGNLEQNGKKEIAALMNDFDDLIRDLKEGIKWEKKRLASGTQHRSDSAKRIQKMNAKIKELEARKKSLRKGDQANISSQRGFIRFIRIFGFRL